jgi:hypothetical protein
MNIYVMLRVREIAASIIGNGTAIPNETLVFFLGSPCKIPGSASHYAKTVSFHTQINYSLKSKAISVTGR